MVDFVYLFRGRKELDAMTEDERRDYVASWMSWMDELRQAGRFKLGEPFELAGTVVRGSDKVVSVTAYGEPIDRVGGFWLISASSLDEATELAKSCPIFRYGGAVEVRPVMKR